ncbi:MAG: RhtB family transporter [Actinomycetia bacterium]|nr:RhtB family transporter [Actinomycetes bacterium]
MPELSTLLLFVPASLALLVIPGPAVAFIVARSLQQGRAAGLVSVLGIHTGSVVHVAAAAAGLSALIATSAVAFTAVKFAGAGYLLFLGIRQLRAREDPAAPDPEPEPHWRLFRSGVVVNVLNPKTAIFFLAFLPQFADPARGPVWIQAVVLGSVFMLLGMLTDSSYALAAGTLGARFRGSARVRRLTGRISGGVYMALGAVAALAKSPALR